MIKIYKNKDNQLECHINIGGYDFNYYIDRDTSYSATFMGSELKEYRDFEENLDEDGEILGNINDIMFELTNSVNWEELFEDGENED